VKRSGFSVEVVVKGEKYKAVKALETNGIGKKNVVSVQEKNVLWSKSVERRAQQLSHLGEAS
jgi:hypothetical protein